MKTFVVGDLQGYLSALLDLLDTAGFDRKVDRLWLAGDLVNRGPQSVETLRFVRGLGPQCQCVLGNHDLSTLASYYGCTSKLTRTANDFRQADDGAELMDWLRSQPLAVADGNVVMVHAGIPPQWDIPQLLVAASELETTLRGPGFREFFRHMYGDEPRRWSDSLAGQNRLRFITNALTRMRYLDPSGAIDDGCKLGPDQAPAGVTPWFAASGRASASATVIFGHWSTLGRVHWPEHRVWGLDTGAVWGGMLTALHLEERRLYRQPCRPQRTPKRKK